MNINNIEDSCSIARLTLRKCLLRLGFSCAAIYLHCTYGYHCVSLDLIRRHTEFGKLERWKCSVTNAQFEAIVGYLLV